MGDRHFENTFEDYDGTPLIGDDGFLLNAYRKPIEAGIEKLLQKLYHGLEREQDRDYSVYTGSGGLALLHLKLHERNKDGGHLECALGCISQSLRSLKGRRVSFLCGDAGPLALATVIYHKLGNEGASLDCMKRLEGLYQKCEDPLLPDELLYGRVGYMWALMFVSSEISPVKQLHKDLIYQVYKLVIDSGMQLSQSQGWTHPLMYMWHDKHYLGAAHGLAGIFYMLMQVQDDRVRKHLEELVRPSVEYMMTLRFPSGNCPSSIGSSSGDKLVHWCHGAPGWIHMFIRAYKIFGEDRYLQASKEAAECVWQRGLLTKGHGICHGVAGNAYAFLAMYQLTNEQKYLYRACKFALFCVQQKTTQNADAPFSLFEGLAGTIYFLADLLRPASAKFPAFTL